MTIELGKNEGLNDRAAAIADLLLDRPEEYGIQIHSVNGARVIDCGAKVRGGTEAGLALAAICLADFGEATMHMGRVGDIPCPSIQVRADRPLIGCLLSQYAGWAIAMDKFFAMGSGPMRVVRGNEKVLDQFGYCEHPNRVVGVLEASKVPAEPEVNWIADQLQIDPARLILCVARTASIAGCIQVVARSLETCMHKLHEVGFNVDDVVCGTGLAYLPPVPKDDLVAIGRTNDSILYGGEVYLWVDCGDDAIERLGPRVPSSASADYGEPFASIFKRYGGDFYKIDPLLFSPAVVTFNNLRTGRTITYGRPAYALVEKSFFG